MERTEQILFIGFNQDASCITVSSESLTDQTFESNFRVITTSPLKYCFQRVFPGSFAIVEILNRSNIIALVGGGRNARYPPSKLIIWDDHYLMPIGELNFRLDIKAVKLSKAQVYVVLETQVYVFELKKLRLMHMFDTYSNPRGVFSLSSDSSKDIIAFPGELRGHACVKFFLNDVTRDIDAHETPLACVCFNKDGSLLATCSDKGTLIRIFLTESKELIQELRRGIDRAEIYSLAFHSSSHWIACSSDTGTIHIYSIASQIKNRKIGIKFFKKLVPKYFESEWSYAHFKVKDVRTICAFVGDELKVVVLTDEGFFYEVNFAERGSCVYENSVNLLEMEIE